MKEPFVQAFSQLSHTVVQHMLLPPDYEALSEDQKDEIAEFRRLLYAFVPHSYLTRNDLGNALRDGCFIFMVVFNLIACNVTGSTRAFSDLYTMFASASKHYETCKDWRAMEAAMYAVRAIARCMEDDIPAGLRDVISFFFLFHDLDSCFHSIAA